jgi:hypothetical protein
VLDGFAVSLPLASCRGLARLNAVTKIYPSVRYALDTNQSPAIIGADQMWATTGDRGDGVKIGVVDDGSTSRTRSSARRVQLSGRLPRGRPSSRRRR